MAMPSPYWRRRRRRGPVPRGAARTRQRAVIWCTGFRPALNHLSPVGLRASDGRIPSNGAKAIAEVPAAPAPLRQLDRSRLATLIGVGRSAKAAVAEIAADLR